MAKTEKPKRDNVSKGKKKAERHSTRTRENKIRAAATREHRIMAAQARRGSEVYIDPATGKQKRGSVSAVITSRREQTRKVARKRNARKNFAGMNAKGKAEARREGERQWNKRNPKHFQSSAPAVLRVKQIDT